MVGCVAEKEEYVKRSKVTVGLLPMTEDYLMHLGQGNISVAIEKLVGDKAMSAEFLAYKRERLLMEQAAGTAGKSARTGK